jgi:hypothetical protein
MRQSRTNQPLRNNEALRLYLAARFSPTVMICPLAGTPRELVLTQISVREHTDTAKRQTE